ncbi:MAG: MlaD family protein [Chitinophagales bacterium]
MNNQTRVGIFAFVTIVIFIFGFYFLKGTNLFVTKDKYYAVYDRVDGLYKSNPVVVNGFRIGTVSDMKINQETGKIVVEIMAEESFDIPDSSIAIIASTDLVGSKMINIKLIPSKRTLQSGDTIKTRFKTDLSETLGSAIDPLMIKISSTLHNLDSVLNGLSSVLNKNDPNSAITHLNASLAHINAITASLETTLNSGSLNKSLNNIEGFTDNLKKNNDKITGLLTNLHGLSDSLREANLKATIQNASNAIAELKTTLNKVNHGDGSIAKIINGPELYQHIDSAIVSLNLLLVDVKENPYRYVNVSLFSGKKRDEKYKAKMEKEKAKKQAAGQQ